MTPRLRYPVFLFALLSLLHLCLAQQSQSSSVSSSPTPTSSCGPSGTNSHESIFSVIAACSSSDGTYGLEPGSVGSDPSTTQGDNEAGASGSGSSFVNLSTADQIAIIVVAVVIGVFGIGSALLYYFAKKRQWELRERLRRSARRVVTALTPRSQTTFNRRDRGVNRIADDRSPSPRKPASKTKTKIKTKPSELPGTSIGEADPRRQDVEKGLGFVGVQTTVTANGNGVSSFEMDPATPKTWKQKFFGRR